MPRAGDRTRLPGGKRLFLPIQTDRGAVGVVGIIPREAAALLSPDERRLLDALLDQAAVAIERVRLAEDVDQVRLQAETERLRNALLTSVSHDLRTPLSTIIGALSSLQAAIGESYDPATRGRPHRLRPRRGGAAQPLRRQPARHDAARVAAA